MSFLTDLFHGNFGNLGTDITHAPASFAAHPAEWAETAGGLALPFAPEILGGIGGGLSSLGSVLGLSGGGTAAGSALGLGGDIASGASSADSIPGLMSFADSGATGAGSASDIVGAGSSTLAGPPDPMAIAGADYPANTGTFGPAISEAQQAALPNSSTWSTIAPYLKSAAPYLGLGGLGAATMLLGRPKGIPQQGNLQNIAGEAGTQGQANQAYANQLESPLTTGVLPGGAEQSVTNATNDAITSIKSRYAQMGLSGSTQELDAINAAKDHATAMRFSIAQEMAQTGLSAGQQAVSDLGLQDQVYGQLMQAQISQDTALQNAIARFTGAVGGGLAGGVAKSLVSDTGSINSR